MSATAPPATAPWVTLDASDDGFLLEHPAGWRVQRRAGGLLAGVMAPENSAFHPNLNVFRKIGIGVTDLDEIGQRAARDAARVLTDPIVIDADATVVAEMPARRLLLAYRQGIYGITSEQWVFLRDDELWTLSSACTSRDYATTGPLFARLVLSFRFADE